MAAILAPHHSRVFDGVLADTYGNDPFVWISPFVWSHCHARSRPATFGFGERGPFVREHDCVFFVSTDQTTGELVCDCVFAIAGVFNIETVEAEYGEEHPIRHYHFDQERNPDHCNSSRAWVADPDLSLVPYPAFPVPPQVEEWVRAGGMPVSDYFAMPNRKNVRVLERGADQLYDLIVAWTQGPGHQRLERLPLVSVAQVDPGFPGLGAIDWNLPD